MAMTDLQYHGWLKNLDGNSDPVTLVVLHYKNGASSGTVLLSDSGYTSESHIPYPAWLIEPVEFEYRLGAAVAVGSLKCVNQLDNSWQDFNFDGQICEIYYGDRTWNFADFKLMTTAIIERFNHDGHQVYSVDLADKGAELNTQLIQENQTDGEHHLICFGHCFNVQPQVVDAVNLVCRYNDWATASNVESFVLRDKGLDITSHVDIDVPEIGLFKFKDGNNPTALANLRFDIVMSDKNTHDISQVIADHYGLGAVKKTGFSPFENNAEIGFIVDSEMTIHDALDDMMLNIGGYVQIDNAGAIELICPNLASNITITEHDMDASLSQSDVIPAVNKVVVNYKKNQSPCSDNDLATSLSEAQKQEFINTFKSIEVSANTDMIETKSYESLFSNNADAQSFANNRASWFAVARKRYSMGLYNIVNAISVGSQIAIYHPELTASSVLITRKTSGLPAKVEGILL